MSHESLIDAILIPATGSEEELAQAFYLASLADPTPRGKKITELALRKAGQINVPADSQLVYSASNPSISGIDLYGLNGLEGHLFRQGSSDSIEDWVRTVGGHFSGRIRRVVSQIISKGGLAIVVANESIALGVIALSIK